MLEFLTASMKLYDKGMSIDLTYLDGRRMTQATVLSFDAVGIVVEGRDPEHLAVGVPWASVHNIILHQP